ncbi:uncharacterized protein LOC114732653 isoform X2 [Neltuma alba]|uniref:uncharacterized protein LOC114732653 isoform X2 n=1 Tax=Neltuma alba TaxID=207710 RepID=UPI0010A54027|nr:uncharacterized protein LOC114732653 isoform X2 [Prosopis alba]
MHTRSGLPKMGESKGMNDSAAANLNFNNPLYLHPSDTQGATIVSQILTGAENYNIWSRAMRIALLGKHKLGFVDGSCTKEKQDDSMKEQWERCNAVVLSWILNSMSKELANGAVFFQDARLVWLDLKERFDKASGSRIFAIYREISSLRQGGLSVAGYYTRLKELWEEQSFLVPIPSCKCDTSKIYSEVMQQQKLLQFLMGLNDTYAQARSQILLMSPLPMVNQAYAMISEDEAQKTITGSTMHGPIDGIAMVAQSRGRGRGRGRGGTILECSHCHKKGHIKEHCYQIIGYPSDFKGNRAKTNKTGAANQAGLNAKGEGDSEAHSANTVTTSLTPEQYERLLELLKQDSETAVHALTGPSGWEEEGDW